VKTVDDLRPRKVRILGREFTIKYTEDATELGLCDTVDCEITIQEDQHPVEMADTIIHEIFHGIFYLMDVGLSSEQEEFVVRKIATGFTQVLMDNPHLLTYLANAGPPPTRRR
jgi:hypothetical protein